MQKSVHVISRCFPALSWCCPCLARKSKAACSNDYLTHWTPLLNCAQAGKKSLHPEVRGSLASWKCCILIKPERLLAVFFLTLRQGNTTYPLGDSLWSVRKFSPQMTPAVKIERMVINLNIGAPDGHLVFHLKEKEMSETNLRDGKWKR